MVTRLYGVGGTTAPASPGFGAWTTTTQALRRPLSTTQGPAETLATVNVTSGAGNNALGFQLVSDALSGAQTITGTVTIVTRGRELAGTDNIQSRVRTIKVYSGDGATLRGTLLALGAHSVTTELGTTLAGYPAANAQALSSVSAQDGDRIVVELGYGMTTTGTTPQYDMVIGGTGTDHANAEGDTTGTIPWIEFSQTLTFVVPPAGTPTWVSGTTLAGATDTSAVVTLPSSLAADDVVVVVLAKENAEAVTPASGYASPTGYTVPTNTNSVYVWWARMVGGETGTITFSWTTAAWRMAAAHRITGCITSGEPVGGTNTATNTSATTPAVSLTGISLPALFLWFAARPGSTAGSWTIPSGFTLHGDLGNMVNATGPATATSSGSITGSYIASGAMAAGLLSLLGGTAAAAKPKSINYQAAVNRSYTW